MKQIIKDKKPNQLKLASMSSNWKGNKPKSSGKNRSQEMQKKAKRSRKYNRDEALSK